MRERKKSYRERYFEDYKAVKVPAENRKGYRVEYRYIGLWTRWESEKRPLGIVKREMMLLEAFSITVYLLSVLSGTPLIVSRLANGFGTLSLVPWILELSGVVRFVISREYVKELSSEEISTSIRSGGIARFILTGLSAITGVIQILTQKTAVPADIPVFLGIMISAAVSLLVKHDFDRLLRNSYRNDNGNPGSRI